MRFLIAVFIIVLAVVEPALALEWETIQPQITKEAELLDRFGAPDEVVTFFPWSEWSAKWKKRPIATHYTLRYFSYSSKSPLLVGPGGKADSVEVKISNSKVVIVTWHYGGPSAHAAAAELRKNPDMKIERNVTTISHGNMGSPGKNIMISFGPNDSTVEVQLALK